MAENEPDYQPPVDAPPPADAPPAMTPEQQALYEKGRADALQAALERQPQPAVNAPQPAVNMAPLPATPLEMLSAADREQLKLMRVNDPEAYEAQMSALASRHAQLLLTRQAGPGLARTVVDSFRARMAYEDAAYFKDVAPLFDAAIAALGDGILGLVGMPAAQQDAELSMRWKSCRNDVLEKQANEARRRAKTEPPPLRGDGVNPPPVVSTKLEEADPVIATMHARYKFTEEQLKMINSAPV